MVFQLYNQSQAKYFKVKDDAGENVNSSFSGRDMTRDLIDI